MKEKEATFKKAFSTLLDFQLRKLGYKKVEEWKGYLKYECPNNYLKFVFEWNQSYAFYCELGFHSKEDFEYSFESIVKKIEQKNNSDLPISGLEFTVEIEEWTNEISSKLLIHEFQKIKNDDSIIIELRNEYSERNKEYNKQLQIIQTKRKADKAWNLKDFKSFIEIMKEKKVELPQSYEKKLSIAEKKLKE